MSLPYEPGRAAFASLSRTSDDLNALAQSSEELPANPGARSAPLAHLERALFGEPADAPKLDGSIRFLEGAGLRGSLELVAEEVLALLRSTWDRYMVTEFWWLAVWRNNHNVKMASAFGLAALATHRRPDRKSVV